MTEETAPDQPLSSQTDQVSSTVEHLEDKSNENVSTSNPDTMANKSGKPELERQGTLSGNNPFRKGSNGEDILEDDDATKYAKVFSTTHESDEELEDAGLPDEKQSEAGSETKDKDFDPLETIYPDDEGDKDDSDSDFSSDEDMKRIKKIKIKTRDAEDKRSTDQSNETSLLPAPPKVTAIAYQEPLTVIDDSEFGSIDPSGPREEAENPWNEDLDGEEERERRANILKAFENLKFAVDWQAPIPKYVPSALPTGKPEAVLPEPPRPETPDPELDIPFHPPVSENEVWRLWLRYPEKKTKVKQVSKYTSDRTWKEIAVTLGEDRNRCVVNVHEIDENDQMNPEPMRCVRLEPYMQLSRDKMQQYDKYGKLHIFKLNHVSYKELVGIRPEKFTIKNLSNLVSHKPKQNVALDHLPVYSEVLKFGSLNHGPVRSLMAILEDKLMNIPSHKDTNLNYSKEEVCCYVIDEYEAVLNNEFHIVDQKSRTRIFCTAFVNGGPHIVLGINEKWRMGREVVRRSDILPIMHDDWINIHKPEFHSCVEMENYEEDHMIKFYPLDGCKFELMRFRTNLLKNVELPLRVNVGYTINDRLVSMRCDLMVPGYFTACRHKGAVPCEDIEIHIPVPEEWIYHFRVEKHHKMGSVHSTLRKPGKIKGFERITQIAQSFLPPSILEASIGVAKYEHLYRAVVWRIPRCPEKNEASYRPHLLTCKLVLGPHDLVPEWNTLVPDAHVEYVMPSSTISGAAVRSISVETTGVAEKFVKYKSKYTYTVSIEYNLGERKAPPLTSILDEKSDDEKEKSGNSDSEDSSSGEEPPVESDAEIPGSSDDEEASSSGEEEGNKVVDEGNGSPTKFDDLLGIDFSK